MRMFVKKQRVAMLAAVFAVSFLLSSCNLLPAAETTAAGSADVEEAVTAFLEEFQGGDFAKNDFESDYLDDESAKDLVLEDEDVQDVMAKAMKKLEFTIEKSEGTEKDEEGSCEIAVTVIDVKEIANDLGDGYDAGDLEDAVLDKKAPVIEETITIELTYDDDWIITDASELFDLYSKPFGDIVLADAPVETEETTEATETADAAYVTDEAVSLSFAFGDYDGTYTGDMKAGLPNGYGTFTSVETSGLTWYYAGDWVDGHMEGYGITEWDDGWIEEGTYASDYLNGEGQESSNGMLVYQGGYANNVYDGYGTFYGYYGDVIYQGNWSLGEISETPEEKIARADAFKPSCVATSRADIYATCESDMLAYVQFTGTVFDVYEDADGSAQYVDLLVYVDGVEASDQIIQIDYILSVDEAIPVEGQVVTVWGGTDYLYSYDTESGEALTVPAIDARVIE